MTRTVAVAVVASLTAGIALGYLVRAGGDGRLGVGEQVDLGRVDSALADLRHEIERLRVKLSTLATAAPQEAVRQPATRQENSEATVNSLATLAGGLRKCEHLLEELSDRMGNRGPLDVADGELLPQNEAAVSEAVAKWRQGSIDEKTKSHFCWTMRDVYRRYGAPVSVLGNPMRWVYLGRDKKDMLEFWFEGGMVTGTDGRTDGK